MEAARLREILKTEYGIENDGDLDEAVRKMSGVNLGIFTLPLCERSEDGERKAQNTICA